MGLNISVELLKTENNEQKGNSEKLIRLMNASKTVDKAILDSEKEASQIKLEEMKSKLEKINEELVQAGEELIEKETEIEASQKKIKNGQDRVKVLEENNRELQ